MVLRFLIFSGSAALVNFAVGHFLYGILGLVEGAQYAFSVAVAFLSGMSVSFALNRRFTFPPSGKAKSEEYRMFFLVSIGGLLLTTAIAQSLFVGAHGILISMSDLAPIDLRPETLSHLLAIGTTAFYSFFAHRYLSFGRKTWSAITEHEAGNSFQ